jgi:hypothetical protein
LSGETGKGTEFVAVLSDQPQGGLSMRHHSTPTVHYASRKTREWADNGYGGQRNDGAYQQGGGYYQQGGSYYQQRSFFAPSSW